MIKFYNTLSRQLEEFKPISPQEVLFYHCGPTVYWTQHIGNLRAMTFGDILVRALRFSGLNVKHVRNYTDVGHLTSDADSGEDKMEKGAKREGLSPDEIAEKYIAIFEQDTKAINLLEPIYKPRPSKLIPEIIEMVQTLIQKGFAYTTDFAVYFEVTKFSNYTQLSKQKLEKNIIGAGRGEVEDVDKKSPFDFALWIFKAGDHKNALQTWQSPFDSKLVASGVGFPGWHIECSVMAKKYLGDTIDIHAGGVEHIPIHHTNEIAQSESANGVPFANFWLHNEHLVVNEEKMAKSTGTGFSLQDVIDHGFEPLALRYFYLTAHYRSKQNFTWEALNGAQNALKELRAYLTNIKKQAPERTILSEEKLKKIDDYRKRFNTALENDLNMPQALAVVWEMVKSNVPSVDKYDLLMSFDDVLGLNLKEIVISDQSREISMEIKVLLDKREELRKKGEFDKADNVRKEIEAKGFIIEDTPQGTTIK